MSSTARGGKRSPADFYATPAWPVLRLLERLPLPRGIWFEPGAGEGAIIEAVNLFYPDGYRPTWNANELREECRPNLVQLLPPGAFEIGDFFKLEPPGPGVVDVTITNPPFSIAMEFIEHSLKFSPWVIHLLRLNFLGTETRNDFFKNNMPDIYVIPDRVSFAKSITCTSKLCEFAEIIALDAEPVRVCPQCGAKTQISTTDSIEYAWFVWGPERGRRRGSIEVLDHTPVEQRR